MTRPKQQPIRLTPLGDAVFSLLGIIAFIGGFSIILSFVA